VLRLPRLPLPGEDLPVASSMQELIADALAGLPDATRDAVRLAALLAVPAVRELVAAGVSPAALDTAEEAGLLTVVDDGTGAGIDAAVAIARRALAAASGDTALAGRIHAHLSLFLDSTPEPAVRHGEAASALLAGSGPDRPLLAGAMLLLFCNEVRAGRPARPELLERALELEGDEPSWLAGTVPAIWWKAIDEHDRARARLHRMLRWAAARGDEPSQHEALTHLGEAELLAGHWTAAGQHIAAARELGEQLGTGLVGETWLAGLLDAHKGTWQKRRWWPRWGCDARTSSGTPGAGGSTSSSPDSWRCPPAG
jgi:hypothetical protein